MTRRSATPGAKSTHQKSAGAVPDLAFRLFAEQSPDLLILFGADLRVEYINPAGRALIHLPENRENAGIDELFTVESAQRVRNLHEEHREDVSWAGDLYFWNREPHSRISVHAKLVRMEDNRLALIGSNVSRETESTREFSAEYRMEDQLGATLTAAEVGVWCWMVEEDYVATDLNLVRLFALPEEQRFFQSAEYFERIHPDDRQRVQDAVAAALQTGKPYDEEFRVPLPDGKVRWLHSRARVERDATGRPVRFPGITVDVTARREAEEKLRESELRLRIAQEAAQIGIWDWQPLSGQLPYWSDAMWKMYGRPPNAEVNPDSIFWESVHPEDLQRVRAQIDRFLANNEDRFRSEFRIIRPDGTERWIQAVGTTVRDESGKLLRVTGANIDLTQWRQGQEALREKAEELQQLMDLVPVAIWVSRDPECAEIVGNRTANSLYQVSHGENVSAGPASGSENIGPRSFRDAQGNVLPPSELPMQKAARLNREIRDQEIRVEMPGSPSFTILGSAIPLRDRNGKVRGGLAAFMDITERKSSETLLARREAELRSIADSTPDLIARLDREGRHLFVNRMVSTVSGIAMADYIGKTARELGFPPEICEMADRELALAIETREPRRFTFNLTTSTGRRFIEARFIPEMDPVTGNVESVLSVAHDVTEMNRMMADLQRAIEEAQVASRSRDRFLAVLSHELRTPLSPVLLSASVLSRDKNLPDHVRETMAMIRRNIAVEARLIDDLLDLSRVLNGKLHLDTHPVSLHEVLEHTVTTCGEEIGGKRLVLTMRLEAAEDIVLGDAARLQQVFWNLVKNAIKFTPEGGAISIRTKGDPEGICVEICDSGAGIDPQALPRLFRPFEQAGEQVTRRYGGLGLGLAICKGLVELHGGSIDAHSDGSGRGARLAVRLPLSSIGLGSEKTAEVPGAAPERETKRILLVEDHQDTAQVVARLLRTRGFEVAVASNGNEAIQKFQLAEFDAIVSDLGLPDIDGRELVRKLQKLHPVPAIAMSGYGLESDLSSSRDAGFSEHLVKPVDATRLEQAVDRVLTLHR